jgi:hypothetical protein
MKALEYVSDNEKETLEFLKSRYPLFHLSNVFFRDLQFGIQSMLAGRGTKVNARVAERVARAFTEKLERAGVLIPVDAQTWVLHYPAFRTPSSKPAATAKPAPPAAAQPSSPQAVRAGDVTAKA